MTNWGSGTEPMATRLLLGQSGKQLNACRQGSVMKTCVDRSSQEEPRVYKVVSLTSFQASRCAIQGLEISKYHAILSISLPIMCKRQPLEHPCKHQSVHISYCPGSKVDPNTGEASLCGRETYDAMQPSPFPCRLTLCHFAELGGSWFCCQCGHGPNTIGWCTSRDERWRVDPYTGALEHYETCDHMCCRNCTPADLVPMEGSPGHGQRKHAKSKSKGKGKGRG